MIEIKETTLRDYAEGSDTIYSYSGVRTYSQTKKSDKIIFQA